MTVRPVRNNNPGDLESGAPWAGLMKPEHMTPEQRAEPRFAVFQAPRYGFRALAITLLNYGRKHGLHTVRAIVNRWAPPPENDTEAYIKVVCAHVGKTPDAPLDLSDPGTLRSLCKAIAIEECGGWVFGNADLAAGVSLALRT